MIQFADLGCTQQVRRAFEPFAHACVLGRVTSLDRGYPLVNTEGAELRAELATVIKKRDDSIVAVGDWVALRPAPGHEKAIIEEVLERRTEIARVKRVGREKQVRRQVLAANVDTVFVCQSLTGEGVDMRLLVRQVAAVYGCGARPVVVLTKSDLVAAETVERARVQITELDGGLELIVCAAVDEGTDCRCAPAWQDDAGVAAVRAACPHGSTALLLGESGVGKSSLVNALLGHDALATGDVRASDDKGRHTTVARRIVEVPGGGLIIDAPGLRTLQILDAHRCVRAMFPEIEELAMQCRFNDCAHESEPGCAVRGAVSPVRMDAYRSLLQRR